MSKLEGVRGFAGAGGLAFWSLVGAGCGPPPGESLNAHWQLSWVGPKSHPALFRDGVKVDEYTWRYRSLGDDCVLFVAGHRDGWALFAACGAREPIRLSTHMDDEVEGLTGAGGLGGEHIPLAGGMTMSAKEAVRRASAQPRFREGWAHDPDRRSSIAAAVQGTAEDVRAALGAGGDANRRDADGNTPLFDAAYFGNSEAARTLLERGARVDVRNAEGEVPLHSVRQQGALVGLFVANGADVNARSARGKTALLGAVVRNDLPIVEALLDAGADPRIPDQSDVSAVDKAREVGDETHARIAGIVVSRLSGEERKAFEWHRDVAAATEELDYLAGRPASADELSRLIDRGADVNYSGYHGATPLDSAAKNGKTEQVRLLLSRGADPNKAMRRGLTPLMGAAHAGDVESIRLLLEAGADVDAKDDEGKSALDWAEFMKRSECAAALRAASANKGAGAGAERPKGNR